MNSLWLALIESNTTGTGRIFARTAADNGFRVALLTADASRYSYANEEWLCLFHVNTSDESSLINVCRSLAADGGLIGITSSSEYFIGIAASLAKRFGLPGPLPEAIDECRNKWRQRLCLQKAAIGIPSFHQVDSIAAALDAAKEIGFPVVVKPVMGSGSTGVKLCRNKDEVTLQVTRLLRQQKNERGLLIPQQVLVEELLQGPEFSVETFGTKIIGITRKHLGDPPNFIETGHDFPAVMLSSSEKQAITETVRASLRALSLEWGPSHVELRLTSEGPKIIEVNPRLAGGLIPELVRLACGIDLILQTIRIVAGLSSNLEETQSRYASIRFILPEFGGRLTNVQGIDIAKQIPAVVDLQLYCQPGDRVSSYGDFRDRIGHVIAWSETAISAIDAVERASNAVGLTVEPYLPAVQ